MSIIQIATVTAQPEHTAAVQAALEVVIARCHAEEDGCELYALHESDGKFVVVEKWASDEALAAHRTGVPMAELVGAIKDKLSGPLAVQELTAIPAGTTAQGSL